MAKLSYLLRWAICALSLLILSCFTLIADAQSKSAVLLNINGAIGPATQNYIHRGLETASKQKAEIVILQIDTPGGLDKSMRGIIQDIIASPIPIIAYVSPSGAHAASAGTFILYASHIAAMAPGTNLGAAGPVNIGISGENPNFNKKTNTDTLEIKAMNDASAYIRSLAQLRDRNGEWAEKAVREAVSLSANEALKLNVINLIAKDNNELLTKLDGIEITVLDKPHILQTKNLAINAIQPDWHTRFLSIITEPNIAYILLIIGVWGLILEFTHPGYILPGVTGTICLLLALYAFQLLPINYIGLGLIGIGIAFIMAEAFLPTFGVLGIGGIIAFVIGSVLLLSPGTPGFAIALPLILSVSIISAIFFLTIINLAIRAKKRPVVSGREELVNRIVTVLTIDQESKAWIRIHGELWQAQANTPLRAGQKVKIIDMDGVVLLVEPIK